MGRKTRKGRRAKRRRYDLAVHCPASGGADLRKLRTAANILGALAEELHELCKRLLDSERFTV